MEVEYKKTGIYFRLEKDDWKYGATKEFLAKIKTLDASYEPPEKPVDSHWWRIPISYRQTFEAFKKTYIDDPVNCERELRNPKNPALREFAYKPIPRINYKFARKRVV